MGFVARRGARLLDEVERSGARRLQTARAWPRAAQQKFYFLALMLQWLTYLEFEILTKQV